MTRDMNGGAVKSLLAKHRRSVAAARDELPEPDRRWHLCRRTGRSYVELLSLFAENRGDQRSIIEALGYSPRGPNKFRAMDGGWWRTMAAWLRMFVPQWEAAFVAATEDSGLALPDGRAALENVARALGINPDVLAHYAEHRDEIDAFLEAQRGLLGTIAEMKLWELVSNGDAATIRWLLPRIRTEHFGDRLTAPGEGSGTPRTIRIIDV